MSSMIKTAVLNRSGRPFVMWKLFFYPEVGGPAYRALTYQIDERGAADATHNACLSSLAKSHAG